MQRGVYVNQEKRTSSSTAQSSERINIATLKAQLSYYLKQVRAGAQFEIMDRDTPIATLTSYNLTACDQLDVRPPIGKATLASIRSPLKRKAKLSKSSLDVLSEIRGDYILAHRRN